MTVQSNNDYWKKRAEIEHKWQLDQLAQDERFNHVLDRSYQVAIDNINKEILANIDKIGGASKLVTAKEMAEYERLAKQTVEHAESLRKQGHKVTYDDFAPEVNERLKVYNATMRINRLEMIKSKIGTHVLDLGMDIQTKTNDKLYNDYLKEMKRQAGILRISAKNSEFWSSTKTIDQVTAQTLTANFNKHLWPNMDVMKADLDGILSTGIIRGDNPREMARWLEKHVSDSVKNKRYVAERLARTESARVQIRAQLRSFKENDYKYCMWHAEPKACEQCSSIARNSDSKSLPNGVYKVSDVPTIPVHPNCRCSLSAYWVDDEIDNDFLDLSNADAETIAELEKRYNNATSDYKNKTGIDVKKAISNGTFSDPNNPYNDIKAGFIKYLMDQAGFNAKPQKVDKYSAHSDINNIVLDPNTPDIDNSPTTFYRGVMPTDGESVKQIEDDLINGKYFISGARSSDYGRGIYVTAFKPTANKYAQNGGKVLKLGVDNKIKILLDKKTFKYLEHLKLQKSSRSDKNLDILAILSRYDAIKSQSNSVEITVLNHGKLQWKNIK